MSNTQFNESNKPYDKVPYYMLAIDPIHIGSGSQRLGRVDMPIVRDSSTNIPKIPATSIIGPARAYSALINNKYPQCAGKSDEESMKKSDKKNTHCGDCCVCFAYGYTNSNGSFQGLAHFFDCHILFFPISSMIGPIWITSPLALSFLDNTYEIEDENKFYTFTSKINHKKLNLGWLLLENGNEPFDSSKLEFLNKIPNYIKERTILVSNKLFSHIINTNLEVRTSVSIDPSTGAAEEGALFTYEAIPRGTIFRFEVVYNNPKNFNINKTIENIESTVKNGLELFEYLGIGGMNTKGMGRLKLLNGGNQG
ncbi:MAG: type III-B CRISPR module RAMP protein Cmr4 [Candidatus Nitrosocaldaceae archaeon]|nr:MAG: type III-B CRISPR module RAMP protein Cmr4 [Candidatus Nitrosocaldaceae archaeon]